MKHKISIRRIVPNIYSNDLEKSKQFYGEFLEMELVMDMGWILTYASKDNSTAQINILKYDKNDKLDNGAICLSVEVSDVDELCEKAKRYHFEIVYPITNEPWGVRRFFVKDPDGATINLLAHRSKE